MEMSCNARVDFYWVCWGQTVNIWPLGGDGPEFVCTSFLFFYYYYSNLSVLMWEFLFNKKLFYTCVCVCVCV